MNRKPPTFFPRSGIAILLMIGVASCLLVGSAGAADAYYTGYLGDVIGLQGVSNQGTSVYLFMTGPGLPTDGVTLTDVTEQAAQGQFTVVDLDSSGHWSMQWDTSRIAQSIDPGTYTVYVTQSPVDYSHLGSSSTYKTLAVYLKDPGTRTGSISSYTLHMDDYGVATTASPTPALSVEIPTPTPLTPPLEQPTKPAPPSVTLLPVGTHTTITPTTTTSAALPPIVPLIAVVGCGGLALFRSSRR